MVGVSLGYAYRADNPPVQVADIAVAGIVEAGDMGGAEHSTLGCPDMPDYSPVIFQQVGGAPGLLGGASGILPDFPVVEEFPSC